MKRVRILLLVVTFCAMAVPGNSYAVRPTSQVVFEDCDGWNDYCGDSCMEYLDETGDLNGTAACLDDCDCGYCGCLDGIGEPWDACGVDVCPSS